MEVFCLMSVQTHWRTFRKCEYLVRVCRTKEATVRAANEYIRHSKRLSIVWKEDGDFNTNEVTAEDLFKYIGENMYDDYIFHTQYFEDGHRKMEHSIYVWKQFVEE